MTAEERFFCAEAARERGDPMAGTAPRGLAWVLVEHRGGWPVNGFEGLELEPGTKARVVSAAQAAGARILLVRRHGRRRHEEVPARWAVLRHGDSGEDRQHWGTWRRDEDLAGIVAALDAPGETGRPPVVLVCAHAQHDPCCAVRGRPVAETLSERWPELVWECSHVGGDRFAPNVVVVPDGVYYGGLDAESAVTTVAEHLAGRIGAEHLRGYTDLYPPQQAAVAAALERFGPAGRHDWAVTGTARDGGRWRIRLSGRPSGPGPVEVELCSRAAPPHRLTCRGTAPSSARVYELTALRVL